MVIKTYPKRCTDKPPEWLEKAHNNPNAPPMLKAFADALYSYNDGSTKYVKLLDGGLVDNFGLSGFTISRLVGADAARAAVAGAGGAAAALDRHPGRRRPRAVRRLGADGRGPSGTELVMAAADTAVQASVRSSFTAFERIMADWQRQLIAWRCGLSAEQRKRYRRAGELELPRPEDSSSTASPSINSVRSAPRCSMRSTPG